MPDLDIEGYLRGKGRTVKHASDKEIHTHCMFCDEDETKRGRLYVNIDPSVEPPGLFHCKLCDERGWAKQILEAFGDTLSKDETTEVNENLYHIFTAATQYYAEKLQQNPEALKYLHDRGLTNESIEKYQLGWADGTLKSHLNALGMHSDDIVRTGLMRESGHDFLNENITIPYIISGNTVQIRGKQIGGKYFTLPGAKARLYNSDVTWDAETVLICEGEFDAMMAEQMGYAAVGVPGANTWQEGWKGYLSEIKRLFIVFDADSVGDQSADKLIEKLDGHARKVTLPIDGVDLSDWVVKHGGTSQELDTLLKSIKSELLISAEMAYEEWKLNEGNPNRKGLLLGIEEFDQVLHPGLLPGQVMIIQAKTGSGKTIGLLNIFQRMAMAQPEAKFLFVSLEQTRSEWFERAWRMYRLYHKIQDPTDAQRQAFEFWKSRIVLIDKNRVNPMELRVAVEECAYDYGQPDVIGVDYLGYWARAFKGEQYQRTTDAVMMLKELAKEWKVPVITPHQVSRKAEAGEEPGLNAARDSGAVEETADFLLSLWAPDQKQEKQGVNTDLTARKNEVDMRIIKSRHGGVGIKAVFQFASYSLVMAPKSDSRMFRMCEDEAEWYRARDEYEVAFARHFSNSKSIV